MSAFNSSAPIKIRPHHGLCIAFFEGKGYSDDFTANMSSVIKHLESLDPVISFAEGEDVICGSCPHNKGHICETVEKVKRYDNKVLELCGLNYGDILKWSDFSYAVKENIIGCGKLSAVCGDCAWQKICGNK